MSVQIRELFPRNTSVRAFVRDPEDTLLLVTDPLRLLSDANGASATYQIFDDELKMTLREDAAAAATTFDISGKGLRGLQVGDFIWMLEDDGTQFVAPITAVDLDDHAAEVSGPGLASKATKGKVVRRCLLSAPASMVPFGVPAQGDRDWGFTISVNPDLLGLLPTKFHRWSIETEFHGSVGDQLTKTKRLLARFDEVEDADE